MHNTTMTGSERYATEQPCSGCGKPLLLENAWMEDGCPCNTPAGVNNLNLYRWKLLHDLQQKDSRELAAAQSDLLLADKAVNAGEALINNLQAKLARYEAAGRELPKEPSDLFALRYCGANKDTLNFIDKLRDAFIAQKVRADKLQAMFGLARLLCLANGCSAETFDEAIKEG